MKRMIMFMMLVATFCCFSQGNSTGIYLETEIEYRNSLEISMGDTNYSSLPIEYHPLLKAQYEDYVERLFELSIPKERKFYFERNTLQALALMNNISDSSDKNIDTIVDFLKKDKKYRLEKEFKNYDKSKHSIIFKVYIIKKELDRDISTKEYVGELQDLNRLSDVPSSFKKGVDVMSFKCTVNSTNDVNKIKGVFTMFTISIVEDTDVFKIEEFLGNKGTYRIIKL